MKIIIINIYSPLCNSEDEKDIALTIIQGLCRWSKNDAFGT